MSPFENLKIKVCGLTQLHQIQELISMKVDFLGFIFYEKSPRYVLNHLSLKDISEIDHTGKVGVFVNETLENIAEITEKAKLDLVQLHGDEDEEFILRLKQRLGKEVQLIKVFRIADRSPKSEVRSFEIADYFLFDTDSKAFGGTGQTFDWALLNEIEIPKPYFLSGGVSLDNAEQLYIIDQQPTVLDINSKFELEPGIKDLEKIKEFINIIKMREG